MSSIRIFAIVAGASVGSTLVAADLLVPQDFSSIQSAINAASAGDRVLVAPGTYVESIDFAGKAIVVESTDGASSTILDRAGEPGFVVTFANGEPREAILRGFTVTGGFAIPGSFGTGPGGGILVEGASATIEACTLVNNTGIAGGGISVIDGDPLLLASSFDANHALFGGGVYVEFGSVTIDECTFTANTAVNFGGAVALVGSNVATVLDSSFTGNSTNQFGGAIYSNSSTLDAQRLLIVGNGEAVPFEEGPGAVYLTFGGGGIYSTGSSGRIEASRFLGNTAYAGGGFYSASETGIELVNCLIAENDAPLGAVYANSSSPAFINCTVANNLGFGVFTTYNSFPTFANSIIAGHTSIAATEVAGNGLTTLSNSLVDGSAFSADPDLDTVFAPALLDQNADYAPLPGSAAIDAGDNSAVPADVTTDLLGNDRFFDDLDTPDSGAGAGPIVDLGAIEFGSSAPGSGEPPVEAPKVRRPVTPETTPRLDRVPVRTAPRSVAE